MRTVINVSAPGSVMLAGEHAVLHGESAAVCAVNKRMFLELKTSSDKNLKIRSALGYLSVPIDNIPSGGEFSFIAEAVRKSGIKQGIEISVESEFSSKTGLGSSAAVTVCTCKALHELKGTEAGNKLLFKEALSAVKAVQKTGSGSDIAASVYGGIVSVIPEKSEHIPVPLICPVMPEIDLYYCGYKMKTKDVISLINKKAQKEPELYGEIYRTMGKTASGIIRSLEEGNLKKTGELFNIYHGLMDAIGVCDKNLSEIVYMLRDDPDILGAKISGSGLGDCVISLGISKKKFEKFMNIPVKIESAGVSLC